MYTCPSDQNNYYENIKIISSPWHNNCGVAASNLQGYNDAILPPNN